MIKKTLITGLLITTLILTAGAVSTPTCHIETKDGVFKTVFEDSEDIYLWAEGFTAHANIYIVPDQNWINGQNIADGGVTKSHNNMNINDKHTKIWQGQHTIPGRYDVIADHKSGGTEGVYDEGVDAICYGGAIDVIGLTVTPELSTLALMGAGLISMMGFIGIRKIRE